MHRGQNESQGWWPRTALCIGCSEECSFLCLRLSWVGSEEWMTQWPPHSCVQGPTQVLSQNGSQGYLYSFWFMFSFSTTFCGNIVPHWLTQTLSAQLWEPWRCLTDLSCQNSRRIFWSHPTHIQNWIARFFFYILGTPYLKSRSSVCLKAPWTLESYHYRSTVAQHRVWYLVGIRNHICCLHKGIQRHTQLFFGLILIDNNYISIILGPNPTSLLWGFKYGLIYQIVSNKEEYLFQ
jgi:hypothetical protein